MIICVKQVQILDPVDFRVDRGRPGNGLTRPKLIDTARLRAALSGLLAPAALRDWMRSPNPAFEGQTPIQVIERGESDRIWQMIFQIDEGVAY